MQFRGGNTRQQIEEVCERLLEATRGMGSWEWDGERFAALVVVESEHESQVLVALRESLPNSWNHLEIQAAPGAVRHVSGVWGGLIDGQLLFALDPEADPILFASWWPWGNGQKSSLRVSCGARSEVVAKTDPQAQLRGCFGL